MSHNQMLVLVGLPSKIFTAANIGRPKDKQTKQMSGLIIMGQLAMDSTVGNREIGTGISEANKRVPIFSFATQGGK